jgi:hypothetical protein
MFKSSVGARAFSAGLFCVLCSCLAFGCEEGHEGHYAYRQGAAYGPAPWSGAIRFEWSLPGTADEESSDDDAGLTADAGAKASGAALKDACEGIGAQQFQVLLLNQGSIVGALQAPCSDGSATWRVRPNDYSATAALAGEDGVPVTQTEAVQRFVVVPGETQVIHLPFVGSAATAH